jgi:hypothetical protein
MRIHYGEVEMSTLWGYRNEHIMGLYINEQLWGNRNEHSMWL